MAPFDVLIFDPTLAFRFIADFQVAECRNVDFHFAECQPSFCRLSKLPSLKMSTSMLSNAKMSTLITYVDVLVAECPISTIGTYICTCYLTYK
jgi:hypothetical protein